MRKLKIGITCYPTVGGSGVLATELGKKLAERGHEVHFITSSVPFRLKSMNPNVFFHEVEVNHYAVFQYPPYEITLASKMADVIKKEQLDVLHVHYAVPHAICAVLAKDMCGENIGIVTTLHGTDISVLGQDPTLSQAIKYGIEKSDIVTAVSNALKEQTYEIIDTTKEIETIYNFVDESVFKPIEASMEIKQKLGIQENEKVVIHCSNFRKIKNLPDIIDTFIKIREKIPAKLLLVGDGPEKHRSIIHAKESPYEKDILFLGKQEKVEELFAISDLKLLMSETESFGLVLLEAMACGVPGIGTNVGGIPEVIRHGVNGYIVELGDVQQAAEYAIELLTDENKHHQFKQNAINAVQTTFLAKPIIDQYEELYERLVAMRV